MNSYSTVRRRLSAVLQDIWSMLALVMQLVLLAVGAIQLCRGELLEGLVSNVLFLVLHVLKGERASND